jgi:hypothetical protein
LCSTMVTSKSSRRAKHPADRPARPPPTITILGLLMTGPRASRIPLDAPAVSLGALRTPRPLCGRNEFGVAVEDAYRATVR